MVVESWKFVLGIRRSVLGAGSSMLDIGRSIRSPELVEGAKDGGSARCDSRGKHRVVCLPVRPGQVEFQGEENSGHGEARMLEEDVKRDAVDDEWRKQGQG